MGINPSEGQGLQLWGQVQDSTLSPHCTNPGMPRDGVMVGLQDFLNQELMEGSDPQGIAQPIVCPHRIPALALHRQNMMAVCWPYTKDHFPIFVQMKTSKIR